MQTKSAKEITKEKLLTAQDLAEEVFGIENRQNPTLVAAIMQSLTMDDHARQIGLHADRLADIIAQSAAVASGG